MKIQILFSIFLRENILNKNNNYIKQQKLTTYNRLLSKRQIRL